MIPSVRLAELIAPALKKLWLIASLYYHNLSTLSFGNTGTGWGLGTLVSIHEALLGIVFKKIFCG